MSEEILNPISEEPLSQEDVFDVVERVQQWRGDLLKGLDKLSAGKGKYVKIFVNASNVQPADTIIATARWIADGHREGNSDDGVYSKEEWSHLGVVEVDNFDAETVRQAVEKYKQDSVDIKGSVDTQQVGAIDLTNPDINRVKLGGINLKEGRMTSATVDRRMI